MTQFPTHLIHDSEEVEAPFYRWLAANSGPEDWHRFALGANWDMHEPELFEWIARQPDCDKATALVLFWKASPDYAIEFPEGFHEHRGLVDLIRERWSAGEYQRTEFAFAPKQDAWMPDFKQLSTQIGKRIDQELPVSMRQPLQGVRLETDGDIEGIPSRFWPEELR